MTLAANFQLSLTVKRRGVNDRAGRGCIGMGTMILDMLLSRPVTALARNTKDHRIGCVMIELLSQLNILRVTIEASLGNWAGVSGVAVDITGAVDPNVSFGQMGDVVLVQPGPMPIQIRLRHFGRPDDQLHRRFKLPIIKVNPLKKILVP